ncbi:unnamed protein product [Prorocentrum cordatum]|uniref:Uncharacterized protein n=1 Tax=Prorocentrum cordatum TaxID=2364126 RepID=A0ABN9TG77_9DINO|nr:unnamed protein product [Polarella glacialis]
MALSPTTVKGYSRDYMGEWHANGPCLHVGKCHADVVAETPAGAPPLERGGLAPLRAVLRRGAARGQIPGGGYLWRPSTVPQLQSARTARMGIGGRARESRCQDFPQARARGPFGETAFGLRHSGVHTVSGEEEVNAASVTEVVVLAFGAQHASHTESALVVNDRKSLWA